MGSQVAVAEVAVVPTFKGFRKAVTDETDGTAKKSSQGFLKAFSKTGTDSGKQVGSGFKKAFEQSAKGTSDKELKALEANVAKASRALSTARLKDQDAVGKVRVAERQLAEARKKYADDSSQVVRAEERLATASRQLEAAHESTERATDDLRRAQGDLAAAADRTGDELAESGRTGVAGFKDNVLGGVKSFAGPLIAAFAAIGIGNIVADAFREAKDFVLGSIDFASDLAESVNAVEVSYGDAADAVLKLGENSAQAYGLSSRELNLYATQFAGFVETIAGSGGDVAGTLETLIGRGTDFASVMNLDVAEALQLFQSGLAGETEPLRKYNVDLSAATVEAYALANGIGDGTRALTEAEKVQARYGLLLEQTSKVQGDFTATGDELANMNRKNAAEWETLQATIGQSFLPVATDLATILGEDVIPVIAELAEKHGPDLAEAFADILPEIAELAEELLPQLPGLIQSVVDGIPAFIQLAEFLTPLLIGLSENTGGWLGAASALDNFLTGQTGAQEFHEDATKLGGVMGWVADRAAEWGILIPAHIRNMVNEAKIKLDEVVTFFEELPGRVIEEIGNLGDDLYQSGRDFMQGFINGIEDSPVGEAVSGVLDWVTGFFPHSPAERGPLAGSGWTDLKRSGAAFWDQWVGGMGGTGPEFPEFPDTPGHAGTGTAVGPLSPPRGGPSVQQTNYFDKTDPREAAELARQMLTAAMRGA